MKYLVFLFPALALFLPVFAQDETQAIPEIQRRIPPTNGLEYPAEKREKLDRRIKDYSDRLWEIEDNAYVGDVGALAKAVEFALKHNEFFKKEEFPLAEEILAIADERFVELNEKDTHSWTDQRGLVIRGYQSSIDKSFQPFGLEIPENLDLSKPVPLLVWLHGRGDKVTDLHFLKRCLTKSQALGGMVADQQDCIILHPFGRQCIGWKHGGEIDVFEAIEAVKRDYNIDPQKIALGGFSMGGAGAWHIGAHYRDQFCAVHAGAGFAETAQYNKLTPDKFPSENEQTLWQVYDTPNYVRNFLNGPVLAYSGEEDKQKQAADVMVEAMKGEGGEIPHIIGAKMGHKYDEASVAQIWDFLQDAWEKGNDPHPKSIELQTRTLRYAKHHWLTLTGLDSHWEDTRVSAKWDDGNQSISLKTANVSSLEINAPNDLDIGSFAIQIDDQKLKSESPGFPITSLSIVRGSDGKWNWGEANETRKRPGLQGPIDDAFLSSFVVVGPRDDPKNGALARWVNFELDHFRSRWQSLFRGKLYEERASMLDSGDMKNSNLILWGDPESNPMIAEIAAKLPVTNWTSESFEFRGKTYDAATHVPVFIFPNPVNPNRYVVVNSGPTFREAHDRTNSLQNPKLPDWAIVSFEKDPDENAPGVIVESGFFDETWK